MSNELSAEKKDDGRAFLKGCLGLFVGLAVLLFGTMFACSVMGGSDEDRGPSEVEVRNQCREWAKDHLRSPSTAEFSGEQVRSAGTDEWTVTGSIDAQNAFGATVRATYTCDIRLDGDTWRGNASVTG